jgi:hypothetical protein
LKKTKLISSSFIILLLSLYKQKNISHSLRFYGSILLESKNLPGAEMFN